MRSVILWYPGTSISTVDVAAGLHYGLEQHGVKAIAYQAESEIEMATIGLHSLWESKGRKPELKPTPADTIYRAGKAIVADAVRARVEHGAEWVIVVSGMYQHPDYYVMLRSCGFRVALLCTETPYDLEHELKFARHVDLVFTNERTCLDAFRAVNAHVHYLPHAWHPGTHRTMQLAAGTERAVQAHDVVFVGTYFEERITFLGAIDWTGIDLGLYGGTDEIERTAGLLDPDPENRWWYRPFRSVLNTWLRLKWRLFGDGDASESAKAARKLLPYIRGGYTRNTLTAALYRKAKVGLNFHRTSKGFGPGVQHIDVPAESLNPRCYELAATGCYFLTDYRAEAADVFGDALDTFTSAAECEEHIRTALADDALREAKGAACRAAVEGHSWAERAGIVLDALRAYDAQRRSLSA